MSDFPRLSRMFTPTLHHASEAKCFFSWKKPRPVWFAGKQPQSMPQPCIRWIDASAKQKRIPFRIGGQSAAKRFAPERSPRPPSRLEGLPALFQPVPPTQSGITWKHSNGRSPSYYLPETTGAGCAFLDFDNDGWMDIFLVNSGPCDFFTPQQPLCNGLYRNNRDGTFTDVTAKAGVTNTGYGMGGAVGDYNGDSYPDLFVTSYNRSTLYRNNGDGTFTDVTLKSASPRRAGPPAPSGSTTTTTAASICSFADSSNSTRRPINSVAMRALGNVTIFKL